MYIKYRLGGREKSRRLVSILISNPFRGRYILLILYDVRFFSFVSPVVRFSFFVPSHIAAEGPPPRVVYIFHYQVNTYYYKTHHGVYYGLGTNLFTDSLVVVVLQQSVRERHHRGRHIISDGWGDEIKKLKNHRSYFWRGAILYTGWFNMRVTDVLSYKYS